MKQGLNTGGKMAYSEKKNFLMFFSEKRDAFVFFGWVLLLIAVGATAGFFFNFWTFSIIIVLCIFGGYIDNKRSSGAIIIVSSVFIWLVGLAAWYFATEQHLVGDFIKEFVLRKN